MKRSVLYFLFIPLIFVACNKEQPPNIIVFFIDDLGWRDLGCYGSDLHETPSIDRLAEQGLSFSQAYSACTVCSPSRAALMSGKYPARLHLTDWIEGHKRPHAKLKVPDWQMYLDTTELLLPEILKDAGYVTANIGKWHLGNDPVYWPDNQGFDVNIGGYRWGAPGSYFYPYHGNRRDRIHPPGLEEGEENEFLTYRLTDEAIRFIEDNQDQRFFLYMPHYTVHTPLQAPDSIIDYYKTKVDNSLQHKNPIYAAMVHTMDQSIGRILEKLREIEIDKNTAIFFTSDNGGLILREITDNSPLRSGKGSNYEGGVRVPFIAYLPWLDHADRICHEPIITMDLFPTIINMAGLESPENDGLDLMPLLQNSKNRLQRENLYWHYPHYHNGGATPYSAVRDGTFKLIEFFEDGHKELYNLQEDIAESKDLSDAHPEIAERLYLDLVNWRRNMNAQLPEPNPNYKKDRME
jgi:arylsulfatase A-like enzyme